MILEVEGIHTYYGMSQILFGVSLEVDEGEVVCLLGRNGVGKTTTLRSIMGLTPPREGKIKLKGEDITGEHPFTIARRGVGFVPEDRRIFPDLTVRENLEVAKKKTTSSMEKWEVEGVFELFPVLRGLVSRKGGFLSGGEQQMLTIARTLIGNPEILLLDEPSEGLSPLVVNDLGKQIEQLRAEKMTILLSEQNTKFAMRLSDRVYILEKGRIKYEGNTKDLEQNEEIRKEYLGV